jgi:hypothetical protein
MGRDILRALYALFITATSALAEPVKITCQGETVMIPSWNGGTMTLSYDGGSQGTLVVKGPHTDFSVPASSHEYKSPLPPLVIDATSETTAVMPDLKAIDTCALAKMPAKMEPDLYSVFAIPCLEQAPPSAAPVPVKVTARVTFLRNQNTNALEPSVQMTLRYLEKSASPSGAMEIELMPRDCKVIP